MLPRAAAQALGPGAGPWRTASPEAHGLRSADMREAAAEVARTVPLRYCFLLAMDGELVLERYYHNDSSTMYPSESAGKY